MHLRNAWTHGLSLNNLRLKLNKTRKALVLNSTSYDRDRYYGPCDRYYENMSAPFFYPFIM